MQQGILVVGPYCGVGHQQGQLKYNIEDEKRIDLFFLWDNVVCVEFELYDVSGEDGKGDGIVGQYQDLLLHAPIHRHYGQEQW